MVVFLDYQNVYKGARETFGLLDDPGVYGQISPYQLGQAIVRRRQEPSYLASVHVYRGRPDSARDSKGYAANMRQCAAMKNKGHGLVHVVTRTLRYPPDGKPQEKGIDVALAVDFVTMAVMKQFDVGVLMSTDTDLIPALEAVIALDGNPHPCCEVAAWSTPDRHNRRLHVKGSSVYCHYIGPGEFDLVADTTDYTRPRGE